MINISCLKVELALFSKPLLKLYDLDEPDISVNTTIKILEKLVKNIEEFNYADQDLDFLSKQYDIKGKIKKYYFSEWMSGYNECLELDLMQIFAGFLFLRVLLANEKCHKIDKLAKYINVCWKVFDKIDLPNCLLQAPEQLVILQNEMFKNLLKYNKNQQNLELSKSSQDLPTADNDFSILPIDVLFYENPIGRAYLEMLHSLRLKPRRLIHLIPERDIVNKKKIGKFLPLILRHKYIHAIQSLKISYWPKYLLKKHENNCNILFDELHRTLHIKKRSIMGLVKFNSLETFCDEVVRVLYDSFEDKRFLDTIKKSPSEFILYTGGGIIPKKIFDHTGAKLLHVHPGYLPDIKGADCFYWSSMLAGRPSATCFIMNSGIDTGDIINAQFLPKLKLPKATQKLSEKMLYRLIYSFIDPWLRAVILRDTILKTNKFNSVMSSKQDYSDGITFHYMHKKMRKQVIKSFFETR